MKGKTIISLIVLSFTSWGLYMLLRGDITDGLLSMIMGELVGMNGF